MTRTQPRATARGRTAKDRTNLYEEITTKIMAELEAGRVPWVQPWGSSAVRAPLAMPKNASTGRRYSGINVLILWGAVVELGFSSQSWLTFRQTLALGGHVRKGECGTTVVFADRFIPDRERERAGETGEDAQAIPFLKRFTVFNAEQCEGIPESIAAAAPPVETDLILPQAEALIRATSADIKIGGDRAFYDVMADTIRVPPPQAYFEPVNWHRTALHELGHWSGAKHRLARDLSGTFGSKKYAQEELVAEMTAAFACASLGIVPNVRHADYLGSWLDVIREDNRAIVRAASSASKAADYLLAFEPGLESGGCISAPDRRLAGHERVDAT
jgi:antirestriction protein ArdC